MGLRFFVILLAIVVLIFIVRHFLSHRTPRPDPRRPETKKMVRCAHCGLHIPEQEALTEGNRYYCSRKHLDVAKRP